MEVCLSLGSNLGDRLLNLKACRDQLAQRPGISLISQSAIYETDPVDVPEEFEHLAFLNAVVLIETELQLMDLFDQMKTLENELSLGESHDGNTPRRLDIDLIYADDTALKSDSLTLPHPRAHARRFVIEPLAELRPAMPFPGSTVEVKDLLATLPDKPGVSKYAEAW